jgi:hypothetical protein
MIKHLDVIADAPGSRVERLTRHLPATSGAHFRR